MIDIGRKNGASCSNLLPDKFRCDIRFDSQFPAVHIFPDRHIFHFRSDHPLLGIIHLSYPMSLLGPIRQREMGEPQMIYRMVRKFHPSIFRTYFRQSLYVIPFQYPGLPQARQSLMQINLNILITVRATGVVDKDRSIFFSSLFIVDYCNGRCQCHLSHCYLKVRVDRTSDIHLLRIRIGNPDVFVHILLSFIIGESMP